MELPLLLRACQDNRFGTIHTYADGCIYEAYFIYLVGNVNNELIANFKSRWGDRTFVCLTSIWQKTLVTMYPEIFCTRRSVMTNQFNSNNINGLEKITRLISADYQLRAFDEDAFKIKPFGFGSNYQSYEDFKLNGSGYVVWYNDEIVSSASSFLTYGNDVEMNLYTLPAHRRKGLGIACSAAMLINCIERQINVHWDAQNFASRNIAEKLGYKIQHVYNAYSFFEPKEPYKEYKFSCQSSEYREGLY